MYPLRKLLLAASFLLPITAAGATTFASDAYDASVHISAGGAVVADATVGAISGTTNPAYSLSGGAASINQGATLATNILNKGTESLQAGLVSTSASSDAGSSATAGATLANVSTGLTNQLLSTLSLTSLLNLGASNISSTTTVIFDGSSLSGSGSSLLSGLSLTGSLLSSSIDGSLYAAPAANTVLLSLAGLKVILNEQVSSATANSLSLQTNAVHIALNNYALNGSLLTGDIILGHSAASVSGAVPEPASWATMIVGLGAIGASMRRKRPSMLVA